MLKPLYSLKLLPSGRMQLAIHGIFTSRKMGHGRWLWMREPRCLRNLRRFKTMRMHGLNVPLIPSGAETIPEEKKCPPGNQ